MLDDVLVSETSLDSNFTNCRPMLVAWSFKRRFTKISQSQRRPLLELLTPGCQLSHLRHSANQVFNSK